MSQEALVRAFMQAAAGMGLRGRGAQLQPTPIPYILDPDAVIAALRAHPEMAAALLPHLPEGQRTQAHLLEIVSSGRAAAAARAGSRGRCTCPRRCVRPPLARLRPSVADGF